MSLFNYFKRKDKKVILDIDSGLSVPAFVYPFSWNCNDENYAELLKNQFNKQLSEYKWEIAKEAIEYLDRYEISALKSKLKNWNGRKDCWKE